MTASKITTLSVATITSESRRDRQAASQVYCSKGFPVFANRSFPGKRLEAHLAGMIPTVFISLPPSP